MNSDVLLQQVAELRESGADRFDPVRFRYIEALAQRAHSAREPLGEQLTEKSAQALQTYLGARAEACAANEQSKVLLPSSTVTALAALRRDLNAGQATPLSAISDFEQQLQGQEVELLQGALSASAVIEESVPKPASDALDSPAQPLKASQTMRAHLQRRAAEKRIDLAIAEGPESPGPLNPQMLAIKALTIMRDISPQYLNRYVSYLDTLFWVEQLATAANTKADKKNSRVGGRAKSKKKPAEG